MYTDELDDSVLDKRIGEVIHEVVPELTPPAKPKGLSFWKAMKKVRQYWDQGMLGTGLYFFGTFLSGFFGFVLSVWGTPSVVPIGHVMLMCFTGLISLWFSQALYRMIKSRFWTSEQKPQVLPSHEEIQRRVLDHMKQVVAQTKGEIQGPDSSVERRIAKLKQNIGEAKTIKQYFIRRTDETSDSYYAGLAEKAGEFLTSFEEDLKAFTHEQDAVLDFFREVETAIPREEGKLADDEFERRLRKLQGQAETTREVSQRILFEGLRPLFEKLLPLEGARQRLILHSVAEIEGPGSIARLIARAEEAGSVSSIESSVLDIRKKLRA